MNYEQAVEYLRAQPEHQELMRLCYLDSDVLASAERFSESEESREIARLLGLRTARVLKIADVGCGNGIAAFAMAQFGHQVFGIDPDPSDKVGLGACLQLAGVLTSGSISPLSGTAESIPLDTESMDRVYTRQAMHHFLNLDKGVEECARVLKSGGMFLGTREHVVTDDAEKVEFLKNHIMQPLHGGENAFTLEEYQTALQRAGLRVVASLGRVETVINYYPETEACRVEELVDRARSRLGWFAGWLMRRTAILQKLAAKRLASKDRYPGRLYSFLAIKD